MKEITDKLFDELIERISCAERFSDENFIILKSRDREFASKFLALSCLIHDIKVHLIHHSAELIKHPNYKGE